MSVYQQYAQYSSGNYTTSNVSQIQYTQYLPGSYIDPPKPAKRILQNCIGETAICCVDSRNRYQYPILFYFANADGEEYNGKYMFAITHEGNLQMFQDIRFPVDEDENRRLIIDGIDLLW